MSIHLTAIHMLAGFAAELNEVEAKLHEALQNVVGIRSQVLYEISVASRPVDPDAPVDQGAPAPGKPPRPTEGGVAVTEGAEGMQGSASKEGGEGSADLGAGACVALGSMVISPKADQALDGAGMEEEVPTSDDPRPASDADTVLALYQDGIYTPLQIAELAIYGTDFVLRVLRTARRESDRRVAAGDLARYLKLPEHVQAMIIAGLGDIDTADAHL